MKEFTSKLLGLPPLASQNGQNVDDLIIYVHWLMFALTIYAMHDFPTGTQMH